MIEILMVYLWGKYEKICVKFYTEYFKKFWEKNQRFAFSMPFNLTEMVLLLSSWLERLNLTRLCFSVSYAICIQ